MPSRELAVTEGAQEIAWVTQKLLSSLQAQRDATLPKSQIALWGTGVLPPHPKWGAWNLKLASRVFLSGNKKSHHLR